MTIIEELIKIFSYSFMVHALLIGVAVAISSSFIGPFLVLKRFSMIGHGLSHVAFAGIAIGLLLNTAPLLVAMVIVIGVSIFILKLNETAKLQGDAAIGLTAAVAMALGTVLASIGGGFNVDLFDFLFGSILINTFQEVVLALVFSLFTTVTVILLYHDLFAMTFEEDYALVSGIKTRQLNTILAILVGVTVVIGIRAMGTLLISSLIIFPTIIAMQFSQGFKRTIIIATVSSVTIIVFGLILSYFLEWPSGSTIVILYGVVFLTVYVYQRIFRSQG